MLVTIDGLEKELNNKQLHSIYLLYGEETYLLEDNLKKIKKDFGEIIPGINYIKLDKDNINSLVSDMETPAFGYEKKLIIARDTGLFKKDGRKKQQANSKIVNSINDYIIDNIDIINESIVLVLVEAEADRNELYETIEKYGVICNFKELDTSELIKKIKHICALYKVKIDDYTIMYLTEHVGTNMQDLINEIRKQIEYAGDNGTITKQSIDLLCIKKIDSIIFDLTDSLGKKNTAKALEVLHGLINNKEPEQKILIMLYNHFKRLYITKLCDRTNTNALEALKLKPNHTFLITKYRKQASYFKEEELRKILEELINLDSNYKIGLIDLSIGLEAILCRYC